MSRDNEPVKGQWYENVEDEETFRVLSVDEQRRTHLDHDAAGAVKRRGGLWLACGHMAGRGASAALRPWHYSREWR